MVGWVRGRLSSPELARLVFFLLDHTGSFLPQNRVLKTLSLEVVVGPRHWRDGSVDKALVKQP